MQIRKKPRTMDAYLVGSNEPKPEWYLEAVRRGQVLEDSAGGVHIDMGNGSAVALAGDVIVNGGGEDLYVCTNDRFAELFDVIGNVSADDLRALRVVALG